DRRRPRLHHRRAGDLPLGGGGGRRGPSGRRGRQGPRPGSRHRRNDGEQTHGLSAVDADMTAKVGAVPATDFNKQPVPGVKNVIAVGAGKGGVGKTTVSVNLAISLSQAGARGAMIDGDIYGPNVPIMLGISTQLTTDGKRIVPAEQYGIQLVSMAFPTTAH